MKISKQQNTNTIKYKTNTANWSSRHYRTHYMLHFHKKVTLYSTSLPATMTDTAPSALGVNHQMFSQLAAVSLPSITISLGQTADMTRHTLMCLTFAIMKQSITQMYQERMSTFTHSNIPAKLSFLIPCQTTERKETFYFTSPSFGLLLFFFFYTRSTSR